MTEDILSHDTSCDRIRFVYGLRKIQNDCSVEQETVGVTLKMTTVTTEGSIAEKNGWDNITLGYIYTEITQAISFHIFYHRCKVYLKPSANFGNILGESSSRILANSAFLLNSE